MRRVLPLCIAAACALAGDLHAAVPTMSFADVQPGMRGVGRTVFEGTTISTFDVEVVGKLPNIGPDQNLILVRCSGGPLERTGILSGMSGSPVLVDGKLIGAVAYTWGFSKEPIAGVTPIEEMLDLARGGGGASVAAAHLDVGRPELARVHSAEALRGWIEQELVRPLARAEGSLPLSIPLSVSGVGALGLARLAPDLTRVGFVPVQGGSLGSSAPPAPPIEPGSAVGVKLVRGDIELTATGTATWVENGTVLAFGHPLFGLGDVDLPLTGALVQTLMPSLMQSARVATPLAEIGALRRDCASGILGRSGVTPQLIPVRFKLNHPARGERDYSFDIANDPTLSPLLLYVSLNGILASRERTFGSATVRVREGSVIKMGSGEDVELDNLFSGNAAFDYGTGIPAYVLYLLMNNAWSRPDIVGVNLLLDYDAQPKSARVRRATVDRYRVRAGDAVEAAVVLSPFRGPEKVYTTTIRIPEETPAGTLTLEVGGALALSRAEESYEPMLPRDLEQLIALINQLRRNDRIYIAATREDTGAVLHGERLPNLPPSVATVLARPRSRGNVVQVTRRSVFEEVIETDFAVEGSARIELEIEGP
jgi:SpoIVB peptidase S55